MTDVMDQQSAAQNPPPDTPAEASKPTSYRQALSELLTDIKWWLPLAATLISIALLTKYLWIVHHPELILSSLGNPSNLVAWLFFALLVLASLLVIVSVPSFAFMLCITQFSPGRELEKTLAARFSFIVGGGYLVLSANLFASTFDHDIPPGWLFALVSIASGVAAWCLLNRDQSLKQKIIELSPGTWKPWQQHGYRFARLGWLGLLLAFTSMSGVFPAQLGIMAWRGGEHGWEARGAIVVCLVIMCLYLAPVMSFYLSEGNVLKRTGRAALALLVCVFANAVLLPAILDVWVYSAGNLIKIRDNTELSYVLDEKDYPQEVFHQTLWQREAYVGPNGLYSVRAFRQFRFGDILLICPARYRNIGLKEIGSYADVCVTLSDAKVKVAAPVVKKDSAPLPKLECVLAVRAPTRAPLLVKNTGACLYRNLYR